MNKKTNGCSRGPWLWNVFVSVALVTVILASSMPQKAAAQGQNLQALPQLEAAITRFTSIFKEASLSGTLVTIRAGNSRELVERLVNNSRFAVVEGNTLHIQRPFESRSEGARDQMRSFLLSLVVPGDRFVRVPWKVNGLAFENVAIVSPDGKPKFEPMLYSLRYRVESQRVDPTPKVIAFNRSDWLLAAAFRFPSRDLVANTMPRQFPYPNRTLKIYNYFNNLVVDVELRVVRMPNRPPLNVVVYKDTRPLWRATVPLKEAFYLNKGNPCVLGTANVAWSSYIPAIHIYKFELKNEVTMESGEETLANDGCASQ